MDQRALDLYAKVAEFHRNFVTACVDLEAYAMKAGDTGELADLCYAAREAFTLIDESRKEARKLQDLAARMFTLLWSQDPLQTGDSVKTPWCIVKANPKTMATVPSPNKDFEAYAKVMEFVGVPRELIDKKLLRTDWDDFGEFLTQKVAAGIKLPEELKQTYTEYKVIVRRRKQLPAGRASGSDSDDTLLESDDDNGDDETPF